MLKPQSTFLSAAAEVQFTTTSVAVDEGSSEMICVILQSTNAMTLEVDLIVDLELETGNQH